MIDRMLELEDAAGRAYNTMRYAQAAQLYRQALALAQELDSKIDVVFYRFWYAVSLAFSGDSKAALAALTPTLRHLGHGAPEDIYSTLAFYINLALDLALPRDDIAQALAFAHNYLESIGKTAWRHELLLLQAHFASACGDDAAALAHAEASWGLWNPEHPHSAADSHLEWIVIYALDNRLPEKALEYLELWRTLPNKVMPLYHELGLAYCESHYRRFVGDLAAANAAAWRCLRVAERVERTDAPYAALARVHMATGQVGLARQTLCQIPLHYLRHRPLLVLDYHLACVRAAAGMPPADDEYGRDFPPPTTIHDPAVTQRQIERLRAMLPAVMREVRRRDTAFGTDCRHQMVQARLERLAAIEAVL